MLIFDIIDSITKPNDLQNIMTFNKRVAFHFNEKKTKVKIHIKIKILYDIQSFIDNIQT